MPMTWREERDEDIGSVSQTAAHSKKQEVPEKRKRGQTFRPPDYGTIRPNDTLMNHGVYNVARDF